MCYTKKKAKIRNPYNQIPHLTQDTVWESFAYCVLGQVCYMRMWQKFTYMIHVAKRSDLSQQVTARIQHVSIRITTVMHNNLFCWASIQLVSENAHNSWNPWYIWIKLHMCLIKHCKAIGMQNCDEAAGKS